MKNHDYPALYKSADEASIEAQKCYLFMIKCQYGALIGASITALFFDCGKGFLLGYVFLVLISTGIILYGFSKNPQETWYRNRALAESVKTITWRYMMRAKPYDSESSIAVKKLSKNLKKILKSNYSTNKSIPIKPSDEDQLTVEMNRVRCMSLQERKSYYLENRVNEQHKWYKRKADMNAKANRMWGKLCFWIHVIAILVATARVFLFDYISVWPVHTMLVISSTIIGWIQIKRFNETFSAYSMATHEIGMNKGRIGIVSTENDFSELVNEIELAFSREHTQWEARRKT